MDLHYLHSSARERAGFAVQQVVVQGKEVDVPAIARTRAATAFGTVEDCEPGLTPLLDVDRRPFPLVG